MSVDKDKIKVGSYAILFENSVDTKGQQIPGKYCNGGNYKITLKQNVYGGKVYVTLQISSSISYTVDSIYIKTLLSNSGAVVANTSATDTPPASSTSSEESVGNAAKTDGSAFDTRLVALFNSALTDSQGNERNFLNSSTQLFGIPFQFMETVDPRVPAVSTTLGQQYVENIISEAPILTLMPGKPKYLGANESQMDMISSTVINASNCMNSIQNVLKSDSLANKSAGNKQLRYYDFKQDYLNYMMYVNLMCRVAAGFLNIENNMLNNTRLEEFDWKQYRYNGARYTSTANELIDLLGKPVIGVLESEGPAIGGSINWMGNELVKLVSGGATSLDEAAGKPAKTRTFNMNKSLADQMSDSTTPDPGDVSIDDKKIEDLSFWDQLLSGASTNNNYVQFYIDPTTFSETSSNSTQQSQVSSIVNDSLGSSAKELQFILGSAGTTHTTMDQITAFADSSVTSMVNILNDASKSGGVLTSLVSRVGTVGSNVISGETMIFPEIYMKSDYTKTYNVSITLKSPYGDKFSYYLNILVPLFHLVALTAPKQTTANTYSTPFIVKAMLPGLFNCTLGIVDSININKNVNGDGLSVDGYPLEIQVQLSIKDLYADLMIAPTNDASLFLTNNGLIDYLAINCGLDVTVPNYEMKFKTVLSSITNMSKSVGLNLGEGVLDEISNKLFQDTFALQL